MKNGAILVNINGALLILPFISIPIGLFKKGKGDGEHNKKISKLLIFLIIFYIIFSFTINTLFDNILNYGR